MAKKRVTSSIELNRKNNEAKKPKTAQEKVDSFNEKMRARLDGFIKKVIG